MSRRRAQTDNDERVPRDVGDGVSDEDVDGYLRNVQKLRKNAWPLLFLLARQTSPNPFIVLSPHRPAEGDGAL